MDAAVLRALEAALGCTVLDCAPARGGDINDAFIARTNAEPVFVKTRRGAPPQTFEVEARGLRWLAQAEAIAVPPVLAVGTDPPFLALSVIEAGRPAPDFDDRLGRGLAALHHAAPERFGLDHDNFIGSLPQRNTPADDWAEFYWEQRLWPMVERAHAAGSLPDAMVRDFERLHARLPECVGPPEPPARLHGDLWSGNRMVDYRGHPVLIDPACYGGHREVDLAMMQLFGGFSPRVFAAYDEAYPLAPGWRERVPLYQLYPLLVHVNLFGGGYVGQVAAALRAVG